MAINFCLPIYKPKITCSTVSADGYEIDNLISPDVRRSYKGFMAESFMKPPITITLEFVCNISIQSIIIAPSVGRQRSSSFEIYTKSIPSQKRLSNQDECRSFDRKDCGNNEPRMGQTSNFPITYDPLEVLIGKGFSQNPDINLFYFENKRFNAKEPFKDIPAKIHSESNLITRPLHHHRSKQLEDVSHMTVRIVRVFGATVPCIRRLEVWGQPSISNNQNLFNSITKIFMNSKEPIVLPKEQKNPNKSCPTPTSKNSDCSASSTKCPEEFIDPITFEVMALPVLLPSGHTVDQSTLDRYEVSNAQWGRPKSDPFTGVPFSDTLKPIPNTRLKTRIDKFLLTAGKEFDTVARTSGRSSVQAEAQLAKITDESLERNKTNKQSNGVHPFTRSISVQKQSHTGIDYRTKSVVSAVESKHKYALNLEANFRTSTKRNCDVIDVSAPSNKVKKIEKATTHEQKLADSLEEAMNSFLATRPNYRKIDISNSSETPGHVCVGCQAQPINRTSFYRLPCKHLMCRNCVTHQGNAMCTTCGVPFNNFDIVRVHLS